MYKVIDYEFRKHKSLALKCLLVTLPVLFILIFFSIYGSNFIKNIPFFIPHFFSKPANLSYHHSMIRNFSLDNQAEVAYVKMLVIRDHLKKLPDQTDCGYPSENIFDSNYKKRRMTRIVKGTESIPHNYPWMASLKHFKDNFVREHFCAGSLIFDKYILTAAHCLTGMDIHNFVVVLGLHHLNDSSSSAISNTYRVSRFVVHENYKQKNPNFDIALIELEKTVAKSESVRSICLPNSMVKPDSIIDKYAVVAGWGRSNPYSRPESQRNLQNTVLKVINGHKLCSKHLQSFDYTNLYCAHDTNDERNSNVCIGDSGGPLMMNDEGRYYNYGIISFVFTYLDTDGNWKCYTQAPSYFIKVIHFMDWIKQNLHSE